MLKRKEYVERVLIVLNPDKTVKAAHQERINAIMDDGVQVSASMLGAEVVLPDSIVAILPDTAELYAQIMAMQATIDDLTRQLAEKDED